MACINMVCMCDAAAAGREAITRGRPLLTHSIYTFSAWSGANIESSKKTIHEKVKQWHQVLRSIMHTQQTRYWEWRAGCSARDAGGG